MSSSMAEIDKALAGGYVYVIGFDNGIVKVGYTTQPKVRLSAIRGAAATFGTRYADSWISPLHLEYRKNEDALIEAMEQAGGSSAQREYFQGVTFEAAVEAAKRLPYPPFDLEAEIARVDRSGAALRSALIDRASRAGIDSPLAQFFHSADEIAGHEQRKARLQAVSATGVISDLLTFLSPAEIHDVICLSLNELAYRDTEIRLRDNVIATSWADVSLDDEERFRTSYYCDGIYAIAVERPMPNKSGHGQHLSDSKDVA